MLNEKTKTNTQIDERNQTFALLNAYVTRDTQVYVAFSSLFVDLMVEIEKYIEIKLRLTREFEPL